MGAHKQLKIKDEKGLCAKLDVIAKSYIYILK